MEQTPAEQPRFMGENFGEFLSAMKALSGQTNATMALAIGVSKRSLQLYLSGTYLPNESRQQDIKSTFNLTDAEFDSLFAKPAVTPLTATERRARGEYLGSTFAEFLGAIKYLSGSTDAAIAQSLAVGEQTIRRYLAGQRIPAPEVADKIKSLLDLSNEEMEPLLVLKKRKVVVTPLTAAERRARGEYLGVDFAEFLQTMKLLSNNTSEEIARCLEVSPETVRRYLAGWIRPADKRKRLIKRIFGLSRAEMESMLIAPSGSDLNKYNGKTSANISNKNWASAARCRGVDTDTFHALPGSAKELKAKNICRGCIAVNACLDYALVNGIEEGVWGGLNAFERRQFSEEQRAS